MSSVESPKQEVPLSLEEQIVWRAVIVEVALRSLRVMEELYPSEKGQEACKNVALTNARYQDWLAWMEYIDERPEALFKDHSFVDEGLLAQNIRRFVSGMEALKELRTAGTLSVRQREAYFFALHEGLREGEYLVLVDYSRLPSMEELEKEFSGSGNVSNIFEGNLFEKHPACKDRGGPRGYRGMKRFYFDEGISSDEAIARAGKEGYRPATEKELIALARANPGAQQGFNIIALGAFVDVFEDSQYVAMLGGGFGRRYLDSYDPRDGVRRGRRLLFVRKSG